MLNKLSLVLAMSIFCINLAQANPTQNPHKLRDQKMQACKNEADQLKLGGPEKKAFILQCMKK
ncbi:MAG: hypothetical protein WCH41_07935 [Methylophilaceae bacterium]|jgi:hypothetical protein